MTDFLGNAAFETAEICSTRFRGCISKELTFSGMEFNHIKGKRNLLERVILRSEGDATIE